MRVAYDSLTDCRMSWEYAVTMLRWRLVLVQLIRARARQLKESL
jgi:hypothetical protein